MEGTGEMKPYSWMELACLRLLVALCFAACVLVNVYVPDSYMDEMFHVPQAQRYCRGEWRSWDPKLTTFPGLYLIAVPYARAVDAVLRSEVLCSTAVLRSVNIVLGLFAAVTIWRLHAELHPHTARGTSEAVAWMLALFPLHAFFYSLFYTDVGSTAFVLACYHACLRRQRLTAAAMATAAVLFRQTNAVWVAFALAVGVYRDIDAKQELNILRNPRTLPSLLRKAWQGRMRLLRDYGAVAMVPLCFAAFVAVNGGIVVGDRSAHIAVRHAVQPLYFAAYTTAALLPWFSSLSWIVRQVTAAWHAGCSRPLAAVALLAAALAAAVAAVEKGTLVHPYLIADNRHYTFYIWRRVLARSATLRLALSPVYVLCWAAITARIVEAQQHVLHVEVWMLGFVMSTVITLVPAWLLEFRYYTVPFMLATLHMQPPHKWQLHATVALYAAVNAATLYRFVFKPFLWPDGSIARFMW